MEDKATPAWALTAARETVPKKHCICWSCDHGMLSSPSCIWARSKTSEERVRKFGLIHSMLLILLFSCLRSMNREKKFTQGWMMESLSGQVVHIHLGKLWTPWWVFQKEILGVNISENAEQKYHGPSIRKSLPRPWSQSSEEFLARFLYQAPQVCHWESRDHWSLAGTPQHCLYQPQRLCRAPSSR